MRYVARGRVQVQLTSVREHEEFKRFIFAAASHAERAAYYLHGLQLPVSDAASVREVAAV